MLALLGPTRSHRPHLLLLLLPAEKAPPLHLPPCKPPSFLREGEAVLLVRDEAAKVGIMAATGAVGASCSRRVAPGMVGAAADFPLAAPLSTRRMNRPSMALAGAPGRHIPLRPRENSELQSYQTHKSSTHGASCRLTSISGCPRGLARIFMFASRSWTLCLFVFATSSSHGLRPRSFPPLTASPVTPAQAMSETAGKPIK